MSIDRYETLPRWSGSYRLSNNQRRNTRTRHAKNADNRFTCGVRELRDALNGELVLRPGRYGQHEYDL